MCCGEPDHCAPVAVVTSRDRVAELESLGLSFAAQLPLDHRLLASGARRVQTRARSLILCLVRPLGSPSNQCTLELNIDTPHDRWDEG